MGKRVLFSEAHGEIVRSQKLFSSALFNLIGYLSHPIETLERILTKFNYSLEYSGPRKLSHNILRPYDILIINNPVKDISPREISAIQKFVYSGGSLLLIGRFAIPAISNAATKITNIVPIPLLSSLRKVHDILNNVSRKFGIFFISNWIVPNFDTNLNQRKHQLDAYFPKISENERTQLIMGNYLKISEMEQFPIFKKINNFYFQGCALELTETAIPLAYTDKFTKPASAIVMAISDYGDGRIFASGSPNIFLDGPLKLTSIRNPQHAQLVLNIFSWLAKKGSIKIEPPKSVLKTKKCPFCNQENPATEYFCQNCGCAIN